jgi:hypothetical protein
MGSFKVTSMGGNLALLRSSVEGDIQRLLRSKNECIPYYFSNLKPWNPGMIAVQREVWIQVYGIPLHIWGDNLFKLIGNKLGVFVDYDEETTSMARFDVARLKILTAIWASIDETVKVEVEGVCFNLWVVEEKGRQRSGVVLRREIEDEGSMVVPLAGLNEVVDGGGGGDDNSGEDEDSGEEEVGQVRVIMQEGGSHVANSDNSGSVQETKEGDISLTCEKSTKFPNFEKEILSVCLGSVGIKERENATDEKEMYLEVSRRDEVREISAAGGTKGVVEGEHVESESGGPPPGFEFARKKNGLRDPVPDPIQPGHKELGLVVPNPSAVGLFEEGGEIIRYSSVSEPEDISSSGREFYQRNMSKSRKQKPGAIFPKIGVPKFVQFAESVQDFGPRNRRKKQQRRRGCHKNSNEAGSDGDIPLELETAILRLKDGEGSSRRQERVLLSRNPGATPNSGINLLTDSEISRRSENSHQSQEDDREKVIQAAKLLSIQKGVGFSFEINEELIIKQLIELEKSDRVKRMAWEQREVDQ